MTIYRIPLAVPEWPSDSIGQSVDLDGTEYQLRMQWHDRSARWGIDIFDADGSPLLCGSRLTVGTVIGGEVEFAGKWTGALVCVSVDGTNTDPYRGDIGEPARVVLTYEDAESWAARLAEPDIVTISGVLL